MSDGPGEAAQSHVRSTQPGASSGSAWHAEEHARFLGTRTFGSLDGLRAVSILVVVWHHTHDGFKPWPATQRGFLGVDLFFVISGFLIVTLLLRERRRTGSTSLRNFYVRRFLRIFPPFYGMLLVVATVAFLRGGAGSDAVRRDLPYAALYVSNLVPMFSMLAITWSLAVEEQFYLVIPMVQRLAPRILPGIAAVAYVVVSLPALGFVPGLKLPVFFRETTFGPILLGVLLACILDHPGGFRWVSRLLGHPLSPVVAAGLVLLVSSHPAQDMSGWPRIAVHWSLLTLVASCVLRERHALTPVLTAWPMLRIGAVSYGIYLFHLLVRHLADNVLKAGGLSSQMALFLATALGTWMVAELSYRMLESRFLALKSRWT